MLSSLSRTSASSAAPTHVLQCKTDFHTRAGRSFSCSCTVGCQHFQLLVQLLVQRSSTVVMCQRLHMTFQRTNLTSCRLSKPPELTIEEAGAEVWAQARPPRGLRRDLVWGSRVPSCLPPAAPLPWRHLAAAMTATLCDFTR